MEIKDLKAGDTFYSVDRVNFRIIQYQYVCPMPVNNPVNDGKYFIFINKALQEPLRLYKDQVDYIMKENLRTYYEADLKAIEYMKETIASREERIQHK